MAGVDRTVFLRRVLLADAVISGASGVLLGLAAGALEPLTSLPSGLLRPAGLLLVPFAAGLAIVATREALARPAVLAVIAANAAWVVASAALLVSGLVAPTAPGYALVVVQALAVLGLAELQWIGLRRSGGTIAAA
jgi:hypothetical protein